MQMDPKTLALLGFGSSLLSQSGANPRPVSLGEGVGNAFQGGMQGYMAGNVLQQQEAERQEKQRALLQQIEAQNFLQENAGLKPAELTQKIMMTGNPVLMAQARNILAMQPKAKQFIKVQDESGVTRYQPAFETGEFGEMSAAPSAEKLAFQNLGNRVAGVDPYTGKQVTDYAAGMRPGEQERLNLGYANLNQSARQHADTIGMQQQRMQLDRRGMVQPKLQDGYFVYPPDAENPQGRIVPTALSAAPKGSVENKRLSADAIMPILNEAENLINKSTASLAGRGVDILGGMVGVSTEGSEAAAQLGVLQSQLMMAQPRMEGPQSDKDVMLYERMAGQIGDPTTPRGNKIAALKTIRKLHEKYATPAGQTNDGWGELR